MKCHIGVDAGAGYVHSLETTAANAHDITMAAQLVREDDEVVYGDPGYLGIEKRDEITSSPDLSTIESDKSPLQKCPANARRAH